METYDIVRVGWYCFWNDTSGLIKMTNLVIIQRVFLSEGFSKSFYDVVMSFEEVYMFYFFWRTFLIFETTIFVWYLFCILLYGITHRRQVVHFFKFYQTISRKRHMGLLIYHILELCLTCQYFLKCYWTKVVNIYTFLQMITKFW